MDALANFAYSTVATAPSPATSGTTLIVHAGDGARFPAAPFDLLMWPVSAQPTVTNAEIARCTLVSTDTLTITRAQYGTSARTVVVGDQVCQPIDANLISQILAASVATASPMALSGTPSAGQIPVATSSTTAAWEAPTPNLLPGAVNLIGHSQLGAVNLGIPEPQAQARYVSSRVVGVLGATNESTRQMIKAGGSLFINLNSIGDGCDWGSIRQRLLPSGAIGTTARQAVASSETYTLAGQFNPPLPGTSQATSVILNGINDLALSYGAPGGFTATGTAGTLTTSGASSGVNLTAGNAFLSGRGLLPGDFISNNGGTAIRTYQGFSTYAQVTTVTFTAGQTVITFADTAQVGVAVGGTYSTSPGNMAQFQNAVANVHQAYFSTISRGAFTRSDDAAFTYGGSGGSHWTQPANNGSGSGPTIAQTSTGSDFVSWTIPLNWQGGMIDLFFVGTSDLDTSGATVTITPGTGLTVPSPVTIGGIGWAGQPCPIIIRVKTTGAAAGVTLTATVTYTGTPAAIQFDGVDIEAQYQSPIMCITEPPTMISSFPSTQRLSYLNAGIAQAITSWQIAPSGGFPAIGPITPNGTNVVLADFATAINKKSFYLGSDITTSTASSITLVGQRTTTQADQQAPFVGQYLIIPNPFDGDTAEGVTLTAVVAASNVVIGGLTFPSWTVSANRGNFGSGGNAAKGTRTYASASLSGTTITCSSFVASDVGSIVQDTTNPTSIPAGTVIVSVIPGTSAKVSNSMTTQAGPDNIILTGKALFDVMWLGPDYVHCGDVGSSLIASNVLAAYLSVPNASNLDFIAASAQRWLHGRSNAAPRPVDGGVWQPRGTNAAAAIAKGSVNAIHFYTPEPITVLGMGVEVTAAGTAITGYFGIAQDANFGGFPGYTITDFGLAATNLGSGTGFLGVGTAGGGTATSYALEAGHYWLMYACTGTTAPTIRCISTCFDDFVLWTPGSTPLGNVIGPIGYTSSVSQSGGLVTQLNPNPGAAGSWTAVQQGTNLPKIWLYATSNRYSAGNG